MKNLVAGSEEINMNMEQIMWGLMMASLAILGFFVKIWITNLKDNIKDIRDELDEKIDKKIYEHDYMNLINTSHAHASSGNAGEVVRWSGK